MRKVEYPEPIRALIEHLKRLPGVGPRSAERIALWMQRADGGFAGSFAESILRMRAEMRDCPRCGFFATSEGCALCDDEDRDDAQLCVVEQPMDVIPLERTGAFRGRYHVLGGRLSPLNHVGPEDLRIEGLLRRAREEEGVEEVILALGMDVEGDATANYLAGLLRKTPVRISRLAQGLPAGGGLESADMLTLLRALSDRRAWKE